jgi:hypothetical protein
MARSVAVVAVVAASLVAASASAADRSGAQSEVTIFARPSVIGWAQTATLYGTAEGAAHEDLITIEAKDCGSTFFRTFAELHPSPGGGWTTPVSTGITSTYRAVWKSATSPAVTIRQRANVALERSRSGGTFLVAVIAKKSFWRKRVELQRRQGGAWRTVRTIVLADSVDSTGTVSASQAEFRLRVPKGTLLRALLPARQAAPCYAQSTSKTIRA